MSTRSGGEALENAFLLEKDDDKIDVELLRKTMVTRRVSWATDRALPRAVQSNMLRPATIQDGRCYLTACENTEAPPPENYHHSGAALQRETFDRS